jgi:hypothetical protein
MYRIQPSGCEQPFSDVALIADYNHQETSWLETTDSLRDSRKELHLLPASYVFAFGRSFLIANADRETRICS